VSDRAGAADSTVKSEKERSRRTAVAGRERVSDRAGAADSTVKEVQP
jgi:hypothetical protein